MNKQLSDVRITISKILDYKKLLKKYEEELNLIDSRLNKENINTNKYLDDIQSIIDQNISVFKSLTEQFYEDKSAGISKYPERLQRHPCNLLHNAFYSIFSPSKLNNNHTPSEFNHLCV